MEYERDPAGRSPGRTLLTPQDVHRKRFGPTPIGRRGYAPGEVREFLHLVEVDLAVLYRELVSAREEANRMKMALREWQSQHGECSVRGRQEAQELYRRPHPRERRGE
ncbi:DivIVA domain-containing protein [Micromonospora sp. NPDC050397]|uniref:DivIVA domain-containing protein n=1 Tax=Micromonospora sp. NPDC050397 TaxID=3364279 RepID=UPI00384F7436